MAEEGSLRLKAPFSEVLKRAVFVLALALGGWFLPKPFRFLLWLSLALWLRTGYLEELLPVVYRDGALRRKGRMRPLAEVEALFGPVVAGLWPRFLVRFRGGEVWGLPLAPGWHRLWEVLRRFHPGLADWRTTPLGAHYLELAKRGIKAPEIPEELYALADEVRPPLAFRGLAFLASLLGFALADTFFPQARGLLDDLVLAVLGGLLGQGIERSVRLRGWLLALEEVGFGRGDPRRPGDV